MEFIVDPYFYSAQLGTEIMKDVWEVIIGSAAVAVCVGVVSVLVGLIIHDFRKEKQNY